MNIFDNISRLVNFTHWGNFLEDYSSLIVIILAFAGWLMAVLLQRQNIKQQLRTEIKYDVYKQFVVSHREIQGAIAEFSAKISPPFIEMKSCLISFNVELKPKQEALQEGNKKWLEYLELMIKSYFEFVYKYINFEYILEDWIAPLKNLDTVKDSLSKEIEEQKKQIYEGISSLQMYPSKHGYDWRKWNHEDIEKIANDMKDRVFDITMYLQDFMVLIHNELLSKYFNYSKPIRKTLDKKYKVLTKDGLVVMLETDEEKIEKYKKLGK